MPCTTILVGKHASNDASTMIARTDDGHFDVKKLVVVEPKDQKKKYKSVISHVEVDINFVTGTTRVSQADLIASGDYALWRMTPL